MSSTTRKVISPESGAKPIGPYSPAVRTTSLVFASGTIGADPGTGKLAEGGVAAETRQALTNLRTVLEAGGSSIGQVVKTTVFMVDLNNFALMNEVYAGFFATDPPARSTIEVSRLPGGASVEIEAIALVG